MGTVPALIANADSATGVGPIIQSQYPEYLKVGADKAVLNSVYF